jgi:hypothetical protein
MAEPQTLHDGDVDPNVVIPKHIREQAARADAIHTQAYQPEPQPDPEPQPQPEPAPQPVEPQPEPAPQPVEPQPEPEFNQPASPAEIQSDPWAARYNSMRGRHDAAQRTITQMQEQMQQLGDELMRTQALLAQTQPQQSNQQPRDTNGQFITPDDEQNYGTELIDLAQRAAKQAVQPELEDLRKRNLTLEQRLAAEERGKVHAALDQAVPNWRAINRAPEFLRWLSLRDVYSNIVRKDMLRKAMAEADSHRVVSFFKGFLAEARATGQTSPGTLEPPAPQPQSRQAAVPLEQLAAPGRVRTAGGDTPPTTDANQSFTRAQISKFYKDVAAGLYAGRTDEKNRIEQQIFAAQNAGRVR